MTFNSYEEKVRLELAKWEKEILKKDWIFERWSKSIQQRVDQIIPEKVHQSMSKAMELAVKGVLGGIDMLPFSEQKLQENRRLSLVEKDYYFEETVSRYKKIAAAEGVGTGVGGILLAAVDYPALLTIKLKFLSEAAQIYGYDVRELSERMFLLKLFQLTYSSDEGRKRVYQQVKAWDQNQNNFKVPVTGSVEEFINWREFYSEYKESIEFKKMLSFIPVVGAVFNGWGNYSLLGELSDTAKNGYRLRILQQSDSI